MSLVSLKGPPYYTFTHIYTIMWYNVYYYGSHTRPTPPTSSVIYFMDGPLEGL